MIVRSYRLFTAFLLAALLVLPSFSQNTSKAASQAKPDSPKSKSAETQKFADTNAKPGKPDDTGSASAKDDSLKKDGFSEYRIGEQDVLNITVWKEPELSGAVMVRPDGMITLPLVNDVHAAGLTPDELKELLTEKLRSFVNVPQVTVAVREINSRKVFIIGQVGKEGSFRINSTTSVLQIIAEAGGLREFANRKGIYVLRNENGAQTRLKFDYDKAVRGRADNFLLRPGDTVVVP